MNNQLIEKVIKCGDPTSCPKFTFDNPLLDKNLARDLAKSFVKILQISQQDSKVNTNLRQSVLTNIRKMCRVEPENHQEIDKSITDLLTKAYTHSIGEKLSSDTTDPILRKLDEFLVKTMVESDVSSNYKPCFSSDTFQSLVNLSEKSLQTISQDILYLDVERSKNLALVKNIWHTTTQNSDLDCDVVSNTTVKMKSEIEKLLLESSCKIISCKTTNFDSLISSNKDCKMLVETCSKSSLCFQICSKILNQLYLTSNFNKDLLEFISSFVKKVRASSYNFSVLYPAHLSHIVLLLDIDLNILIEDERIKYMEQTKTYLCKVNEKSESDFIMVLSHFPQWFDVFYNKLN